MQDVCLNNYIISFNYKRLGLLDRKSQKPEVLIYRWVTDPFSLGGKKKKKTQAKFQVPTLPPPFSFIVSSQMEQENHMYLNVSCSIKKTQKTTPEGPNLFLKVCTKLFLMSSHYSSVLLTHTVYSYNFSLKTLHLFLLFRKREVSSKII